MGARVAIIDYGMGNLFSIWNACRQVGLEGVITSDQAAVRRADAVILPGVGAFGHAMATLRRKGLEEAMREVRAKGRPLIGICLGMQLFMDKSWEFGEHQGLGFFAGEVAPFDVAGEDGQRFKVPHVGWTRVHDAAESLAAPSRWAGSPLSALPPGERMYFVHSFYVQPRDPAVELGRSTYGPVTYCSALWRDNLVAFQFHPERSGPAGIAIYAGLKRFISTMRPGSTP